MLNFFRDFARFTRITRQCIRQSSQGCVMNDEKTKTTPIQTRLRDEFLWRDVKLKKLADEAADEIERLRGLLHEVFDSLNTAVGNWYDLRKKFIDDKPVAQEPYIGVYSENLFNVLHHGKTDGE
jgi:hypothetical protein